MRSFLRRLAGLLGAQIGGFGGSVPVVVLVLAEQLQGSCGLSQNADGFGTADVHRIRIALQCEDVGDSVDGGFEPDGVTGGGAGNDQLQPVLAVAAEPHEPFLGGSGGLLFGTHRVSVDDLGVQQGLQPPPRECPKRGCKLLIDPAGLFGGEVSGGGGDPAGLVGRQLPGEGGTPDGPEPVPQIQSVTDQPARRSVGDAQYTAEFGGGEVGDGGGAVPTQPHRMLTAGQPTLGYGVAGVEVGPVGGDLEPSGFGGGQGVFVGLGCGQGAGRIQLHQIIIIEHTFNIKGAPDTFPPFGPAAASEQHLADPDNTRWNRTAPNGGKRFRQGAARPDRARLGRSFAGHPAGQAICRMATGKLSVASGALTGGRGAGGWFASSPGTSQSLASR